MLLRPFAVAVSLALASLALGCAGLSPHADNVPQETVDADYSECQSRATVSTALVKSAGEAEDKQQAIIDECMKEKGYSVK
ncbi:MAG: hypothetical protein ACLGQH_02395 [Acidobacteriota bacterium]